MSGTAALDQLIANAWPAEVSEQLEAWRLRSTRGFSRRANSALAVGAGGEIARLVDHSERFYRSRGAEPMFQVSTASAPAGLSRYLDKRGYVATARTLVAQAPTATMVGALDARQAIEVASTDTPTDEWFDTYWSVSRPGGSPSHAELCRSVLLVSPLEKVFVTAYVNGQAVGVGQAVFEGGFAGVQCMATHRAQRRHGVGSAILTELGNQVHQRHVPEMYLAVMAANDPALRLYGSAGFRTVHEYRYFTASM